MNNLNRKTFNLLSFLFLAAFFVESNALGGTLTLKGCPEKIERILAARGVRPQGNAQNNPGGRPQTPHVSNTRKVGVSFDNSLGRFFGPILRITNRKGPKLAERRKLRIATWNMGGIPEEIPEGIDLDGEHIRNLNRLGGQAKTIEDLDADIMILQEVPSPGRLKGFARDDLNDEHFAAVLEGNDNFANHHGVLIRKGAPVDVEVHSFHKLRIDNKRVFSKDSQVVVIKDQETGEPIMNIVNLHLKARRDIVNRDTGEVIDPQSREKRLLEMSGMEKILEEMENRQGRRVATMFGGDFNNNYANPDAREFDYFRQSCFKNVFRIPGMEPIRNSDTQYYFPNEGGRIGNQMDNFIIDEHLTSSGAVMDRGIYRYRTLDGSAELPLPTSLEERLRLPSDHYPVWVDLDPVAILSLMASPLIASEMCQQAS